MFYGLNRYLYRYTAVVLTDSDVTMAPSSARMQASATAGRERSPMATGELEVFVHGQGAKPPVVAAALTDSLRDVVLHTTADAVVARERAQWGLE